MLKYWYVVRASVTGSVCATENHSIFSMKYYYVMYTWRQWMPRQLIDNKHGKVLIVCAPVCKRGLYVCAHRPLLKMCSTKKWKKQNNIQSLAGRAFTEKQMKNSIKRRYALVHTTLTNAFIEREIFLRRTVSPSLQFHSASSVQSTTCDRAQDPRQPRLLTAPRLCAAAKQKKKTKLHIFNGKAGDDYVFVDKRRCGSWRWKRAEDNNIIHDRGSTLRKLTKKQPKKQFYFSERFRSRAEYHCRLLFHSKSLFYYFSRKEIVWSCCCLRIILSVTEAIASYDTWNGNGRRRVKQNGYSRQSPQEMEIRSRRNLQKHHFTHFIDFDRTSVSYGTFLVHRVPANETAFSLAHTLAHSRSLKVSIYTTICLISFLWLNAAQVRSVCVA